MTEEADTVWCDRCGMPEATHHLVIVSSNRVNPPLVFTSVVCVECGREAIRQFGIYLGHVLAMLPGVSFAESWRDSLRKDGLL